MWDSEVLRKVQCWLLTLVVVASGCPTLAGQTTAQLAMGVASDDELALQIIVVNSRETAAGIVRRLESGEDFAAIARAESVDPTASDGGSMGRVPLSTLRPELREAIKGVKPGALSPIVQVPLGFAIVKVVENAENVTAATTQASSATGSVKYTLGVGGLGESLSAMANFSKPPGWNQDLRMICSIRTQSLAAEKQALAQFLSPANEQARSSYGPMDVMSAHYSLGELYSYEGDMVPALEQYQEAFHVAETQVPMAVIPMNEALGVAYLHKSQMENEAYTKPGGQCLLPMKRESAGPNTADSEKAIDRFLEYLAEKPDDLEVRWLLNLAYMTVGGYPEKVPAKYLIPPSAFTSKEDLGRFRDVAAEAGLDFFSTAGGVIVDDFENNGRLDIVVSSFNACERLHYFHNNGDGTFTEQGIKAGLGDQLGGLSIVQTDYNNDGCLDILVMRGAWELPQRRSLLRNNCDGTFTDVTIAAGLGEPTSSQASVWVDVNNDGLLDLFVANEDQPAQLFLNRGDGTFQDISMTAGIDKVMYSKGVAAADYDNDGWPDLYVSNLNGYNFLYHNNHDNTFTEVAGSWGAPAKGHVANVPGSGHGFATWFFDYDNDGWSDLFVTSYYVSLEESAKTYLGLPHNATTLKLYKNLGNGTFRDVTEEVGLDKVFMPMGANFGDIDNDGYLDMYLGTGNPSYGSLVPSVLLHNKAGRSFLDITTSSGTADLHKGHGVAFADLANNGNEDIVFRVGGATLGDSHALRLFENPGHNADWITLKLVGVKTNRPAIGARIKVTVDNKGTGTRSIYRTVSSGGSFGASPLQQHIGLGKNAKILDIEIWWPTSNTRQHFTNIAKNQLLEIKEFAQNYAKLERPVYRLGGGHRDAPNVAMQSQASPNSQ